MKQIFYRSFFCDIYPRLEFEMWQWSREIVFGICITWTKLGMLSVPGKLSVLDDKFYWTHFDRYIVGVSFLIWQFHVGVNKRREEIK